MGDQSEDEFFSDILVAQFEGAVWSGAIPLDGMTDEQVLLASAELISEALDDDPGPPTARITHQESLLAEAHRYRDSGAHNFAIMFLATWVEHWLNNMIICGLERQGANTEATLRALKGNLPDKKGKTWNGVWSPLPVDVTKRIKQLADSRNEFVHYKWPTRNLFEPTTESQELEQVSDMGVELVADLREIENQMIFGGRREELAAKVRSNYSRA